MRDETFQVFRGRQAILERADLLLDLADRSGQSDLLRDLPYYLAKPGLFRRTPVLLALLGRNASARLSPSGSVGLLGAVLLFEYQMVGVSPGMFTSNDRSGRRTLIAMPNERPRVAALTAEYLLERGAHVVMFSFRTDAPPEETCKILSRNTPYSLWVSRQREVADFLPLAKTFDQTLASVGKRTRTHMRYYRRRAEAEIGCVFEPQCSLSTAELIEFNRDCMYAVPDETASWRLEALKEFEDPILMALRDREGRLLSVIGGRRVNSDSEIFWQMNRADLPSYSLSLVMRTYFIEHEVARGARRLYLDGGSAQSISNSFTRGSVTDLAVLRRTPLAFLARKLARRVIPQDNELGRLLAG